MYQSQAPRVVRAESYESMAHAPGIATLEDPEVREMLDNLQGSPYERRKYIADRLKKFFPDGIQDQIVGYGSAGTGFSRESTRHVDPYRRVTALSVMGSVKISFAGIDRAALGIPEEFFDPYGFTTLSVGAVNRSITDCPPLASVESTIELPVGTYVSFNGLHPKNDTCMHIGL